MKIVMLSDLETSGGAAIAASRLAGALIRTGHEVVRIVGWPQEGTFPWNTELLRIENSLTWRAARRMLPDSIFEKKLSFQLCNRLHQLLDRIKPDFINVHNLHSCFPQGWRPDLIRVCAQHARTIWTLHDMWSFTGRCAYNYDCEKFVTGCDHLCPTPDEYPALDSEKIHHAWQQRLRIFQTCSDLAAVTPSAWLAEEAKRGFWRSHSVRVIPNGIDVGIFRPLDRAEARRRLGMSEAQTPVLLVVGHRLSERRKGVKILLNALQKLKSSVTVITMGADPPVIQRAGIKHVSLGYREDDETKVLAYNAADLFVHPSLVENQPNVILEAMACGTPVVAFASGGIPEIVRPNVTGWLSTAVSPDALSNLIETAIDQGANLRDSCRTVAEIEYNDDLQARRYLEFMSSLHAVREDAV